MYNSIYVLLSAMLQKWMCHLCVNYGAFLCTLGYHGFNSIPIEDPLSNSRLIRLPMVEGSLPQDTLANVNMG